MNDVPNALTFDVEEYFQVANYRGAVPRKTWDSLPRRTPEQVRLVLRLLEEARVRATFFVLGWVAEREPDVVREIAAGGHEVASHGYEHRFVHELGREGFRDDLRRTAGILERITGRRVEGFRASTFTITERTPWALPLLAEEGYRFDSSVFPVRHPTYGMPDFPRVPVRLPFGGNRSIVEFPPLTARVLGANLPVGGGGYFRLLPLAVTKWALRRRRREGFPAALYLHPWEFDPHQPRVAAGALATLRHRIGLGRTVSRLRSLLRRFEFAPMGEVVDRLFGPA